MGYKKDKTVLISREVITEIKNTSQKADWYLGYVCKYIILDMQKPLLLSLLDQQTSLRLMK